MGQISKPGIAAGRLEPQAYVENFADLHPPLNANAACSEAQRCLFCHDAPCMMACPTHIDVPMFIRQIATGNQAGAARTIYAANIIGGICARVCPTETLCEEVCVQARAGNPPVRIGQLQRFATDAAMQSGRISFHRGSPSGKRAAIVGAGPAGLSCAHRLAARGHDVRIFEAREKPGGLNEYGLAAYKATNNFARREADFVLSIGGIELRHGQLLGENLSLDDLTASFDAVFLGLGLGAVLPLGIKGEELDGVLDAVTFIEDLRQSADLSALPVGRQVVVIGGGMTAIDIAVQCRKLGSRDVTIVYRRGPEQMGASEYERQLAQGQDVNIVFWARPREITGANGQVKGVEFERTALDDNGGLTGTGEIFRLAADQVFRAIGQVLDPAPLEGTGLAMSRGRIVVDEHRKTSRDKVWAGGDCVAGGKDLTVAAAEDGNLAAAAIDRALRGEG
ncbi:MAG TPA: NAD(P)-dependent oxidoreductase [Rhizobiales bacterium]|nr:NAD(P)-dependent oxidoreductase [Hyphomicrobiales bacterium]